MRKLPSLFHRGQRVSLVAGLGVRGPERPPMFWLSKLHLRHEALDFAFEVEHVGSAYVYAYKILGKKSELISWCNSRDLRDPELVDFLEDILSTMGYDPLQRITLGVSITDRLERWTEEVSTILKSSGRKQSWKTLRKKNYAVAAQPLIRDLNAILDGG